MWREVMNESDCKNELKSKLCITIKLVSLLGKVTDALFQIYNKYPETEKDILEIYEDIKGVLREIKEVEK